MTVFYRIQSCAWISKYTTFYYCFLLTTVKIVWNKNGTLATFTFLFNLLMFSRKHLLGTNVHRSQIQVRISSYEGCRSNDDVLQDLLIKSELKRMQFIERFHEQVLAFGTHKHHRCNLGLEISRQAKRYVTTKQDWLKLD